MRCDLCKKGKATVHITAVRIHLCSRFAKKNGAVDPTGFSFANLFTAPQKY